MVKNSWSESQSSSGDVRVFMYYFFLHRNQWQKLKMPVFCAVYEWSNRPNRENKGAFIVYENVLFIRGKVKQFTEKRRKTWLVNLRLRSTGAGVPQQWRHVQTTYWTKRHAAQWWRLREFSLQKVSRQRGTSQGYPLCQWNGNLLATRGSITCWLQTRLYINLPNLQHKRPLPINKKMPQISRLIGRPLNKY